MKEIVVKKRILLSILSIGFTLFCNVATAAMVVNKTDKVQVEVYGQINRAVLYANDGDKDDFYHVDNDNSSTRIGVITTAKPNDIFTVGAHMEYEYESNASNQVWQRLSDTDDDGFTDRILEVFIQCRFGKLSLGQGQTASDGTTEIDLSGTTVVGSSKTHSLAGGMHFFDDAPNSLSDATVGDAFNNLDGFNRKDRVRYDSPSCKGFSLAVSSGSDDGTDGDDLALRYTGEIAGIKTAGAVSYVNYSGSGSKDNQVSGSLSFLATNGLNLTMASGMREDESTAREDATYYYGKIGYIAQLFDLGSTAFAIDYGKFEEMKVNDDKGDTIGVLAVQKLENWNTELYFGYRHYELDRTDSDFDDIDALMSGLRIKF
ncbi:MAG: porin [Desulfobacterium sp.]|nr:porin [Desulfobacterium sp.]